MKNAPVMKQSSFPKISEADGAVTVPPLPPEQARMYTPPYSSYMGQVALAVCILAAGLVTGLEQGRKPYFLTQKEASEQTQLQSKMDSLKKQIEDGFPESAKFAGFSISSDGGYLLVQFGTAKLFPAGQGWLVPQGQKDVQKLAGVIHGLVPDAPIEVDGYTDDTPMQKNAWPYPTNWELSGARAARVMREFMKAGYSQDSLKFIGWGESHPLVPNHDEAGHAIPANQERNRRVVIRINLGAPPAVKK